MKEYFFKNKSMYVVGDIHGDFGYIKWYVKQKKITDTVFLFAGDVGLGFYKKAYYDDIFNKLNKYVSQKNVYLLFGRGNHDDKSYFDNETINFSNIKTVPDYSVIKIKNEWSDDEFIALYVGGGISIDRLWRMKNEDSDRFIYRLRHKNATDDEVNENIRKLYWPNEAPFFDIDKLNEIVEKYKIIDCMASHTCPSFTYPIDKRGINGWLEIDSELEKDVDEERQTMTNIYNFFKDKGVEVRKWVYGHFHEHNEEIYENTSFILLNHAQFKFDCIQVI